MTPTRDWREALFARRTLGVRLGTRSFELVLDALLPGLRARPPFRVAQIVGTNGKGSTAAMLEHGLRARVAGPVGLFTSPHLHRVGERVRIDGAALADGDIRAGVERVAAAEARAGVSLSFFEVLTAVALERFVAAGCTHVVLEAGLGGRLDATTAAPAELTLITRIGLDHQNFLGDDLASIAGEKAAVIRRGVPVFSVAQRPEAEAVIVERAAAVGAPLEFVAPLDRAPPSLPGAHQRHNAALALAGLGALLDGAVDPGIFAGLRWPGRLEAVTRGRGRIWFDVAHNFDGIEALRAALEELGVRPAAIVFGAMADKPAAAMARCLAELAPLWLVPPRDEGAAELDAGLGARRFPSAEAAGLRAALDELTGQGSEVVVCGSHFLVAALRAWALGLDAGQIDDPSLSDPMPRTEQAPG